MAGQSPEEYEKRGSYLFRSSTLNKYPPRIAGDGTATCEAED